MHLVLMVNVKKFHFFVSLESIVQAALKAIYYMAMTKNATHTQTHPQAELFIELFALSIHRHSHCHIYAWRKTLKIKL